MGSVLHREGARAQARGTRANTKTSQGSCDHATGHRGQSAPKCGGPWEHGQGQSGHGTQGQKMYRFYSIFSRESTLMRYSIRMNLCGPIKLGRQGSQKLPLGHPQDGGTTKGGSEVTS